MSKAREAHRKSVEGMRRRPAEQEPAIVEKPVEPLRPRPRLLILMTVVLLVLLGSLMALYFKTVYPHRNSPHAIETDDAPASR